MAVRVSCMGGCGCSLPLCHSTCSDIQKQLEIRTKSVEGLRMHSSVVGRASHGAAWWTRELTATNTGVMPSCDAASGSARAKTSTHAALSRPGSMHVISSAVDVLWLRKSTAAPAASSACTATAPRLLLTPAVAPGPNHEHENTRVTHAHLHSWDVARASGDGQRTHALRAAVCSGHCWESHGRGG